MNQNLDRKMDEVYNEGYQGYIDGVNIDDNPYNNLKNGWDIIRHWQWGWEGAKSFLKK